MVWLLGVAGFQVVGGGGSIEPPKSGGGGWEKGSIDRHHQSVLMKSGFSPNTWQMMTFLDPLDVLVPKVPFSFFADFLVWVTSEARGSVSVGFLGTCRLSPFGGGGLARGLYRPPPHLKARPPLSKSHCTLVLHFLFDFPLHRFSYKFFCWISSFFMLCFGTKCRCRRRMEDSAAC